MTEIVVREKGSDFEVLVAEEGSQTTHHVKLSEVLYQGLTGGQISKAACVEASFRFLLKREPKESILGRFELGIISRYFPEFETKFKEYI